MRRSQGTLLQSLNVLPKLCLFSRFHDGVTGGVHNKTSTSAGTGGVFNNSSISAGVTGDGLNKTADPVDLFIR